jgi:hypothetical protein
MAARVALDVLRSQGWVAEELQRPIINSKIIVKKMLKAQPHMF